MRRRTRKCKDLDYVTDPTILYEFPPDCEFDRHVSFALSSQNASNLKECKVIRYVI
jgi:hypothetical protein